MGTLHKLQARGQRPTAFRVHKLVQGADTRAAARTAVRYLLRISAGGLSDVCGDQDSSRCLVVSGGTSGLGAPHCGGFACCSFHFGLHLITNHSCSGRAAFEIGDAIEEGFTVELWRDRGYLCAAWERPLLEVEPSGGDF